MPENKKTSTNNTQMTLFGVPENKKLSIKNTKQANRITAARYSIPAIEMNMLCLLITKLKEDDSLETKYKISVKELEEMSGCMMNYSRLKKHAISFRERSFFIETEDGFEAIGIGRVKYKSKEGELEFEIGESFKQYLFDMSKGFTLFNPQITCNLSSVYAKRFYMLCCMWLSTGVYYTSVSDLRKILGLIDQKTGIEKYALYGIFKKKVLEVGLKEVNEKTDLNVEVVEIKKEKKITTLHFHISKKEKTKLIEEKKAVKKAIKTNNTTDKKIIYHQDEPREGRRAIYTRLIDDCQLVHEQAEKIILNFEYKTITKILHSTQLGVSDGKINHVANFVWGCFNKIKRIQ